jgi:hypothetical protein
MPNIWQIHSLPQGNSVPLIVLESGIHFPLVPEGEFPCDGYFMRFLHETIRFSSGSTIANVE